MSQTGLAEKLADFSTSMSSEDNPTSPMNYSTDAYPYNCVVLIETEFPDIPGYLVYGTGVAIGPHTILTTSTLLWDPSHGDEANYLAVYPGYNQNGRPNPPGSGNPVNGSFVWHDFHVGNADDTISLGDIPKSYAIIDTNYTFTNWMSLLLNYDGGKVHLTGYPDYNFGLQTDVVGTVSKDLNYSIFDYGTVTSSFGDSGGPLWLTYNGTDVVCGINAAGNACQLTSSVWNQILAWQNADSYLWGGGGGGSTAYLWNGGGGGGGGGGDADDDFNGDGTSDILWRNLNGTVVEWNISDNGRTGSTTVGAIGTRWEIAGTGDFNNDGTSDILWRHAGGTVATWEMGNGHRTGSTVIADPGGTWSIKGVGDFNRDGTSDILWRNTNGTVAIWRMSNGLRAGATVIANPGGTWDIANVGDFNGDGTDDILWRNTSGTVETWEIGQGRRTGWAIVGSAISAWSVAGVGDFNGDGTDDILWRNTSGTTAVWQMSNGQVASTALIPNPGGSWRIV
jgi:V8-like Glu-specific endopeptidase